MAYIRKGTCGACNNFEWDGYGKGYCKWYGTYYDDDDSCSHYEDGEGETYTSSGSGGCFLTTACCEWKGLPDACDELQQMRDLRDNYVSKQSYGKELIDLYYKDAPKIVSEIEKRPDRERILESIYQEIHRIMDLKKSEKYSEATIAYLMMVYRLLHLISE